MIKKSLCLVTALLAALLLSPITQAGTMSGSTYSITTSVVSSGGGPAVSTSGTYEMNATIGQPSPLAEESNPPTNDTGTVELKPGFWNTVGGTCLFDNEPDGDVDGMDIAAYAATSDFASLSQFAAAFANGCQ